MDEPALHRLGEQYLQALRHGNPEQVPLAPGYRATENLSELPIGAGLWRSTQSFAGLQVFADAVQRQWCCLGVVVIEGQRRPFALRLACDDGQVCEAEAVVGSDPKGHFADVDQLLRPDVLYDAPVPPARGVDRAGLQRAADSYWSALQESDGSMARFDYRCDRYDNGKKITNNLSTLLSPDAAVHTVASCLNATRGARPLARGRRYPVLDVGRGVAISLVTVDFHPVPDSPRPDNGSFYMMAAFKVVDGRIRQIDEIREILPLGVAQAW
jgi:hypothetical protein